MAKLIETRLPTVTTEAVTYKEFNRLVRVLEINLNRFDPDATLQISTTTRDAGNFEKGSIIWNATEGQLQVYTGNAWISLTDATTPTGAASGGLQAVSSLGSVTIGTNGDVVFVLT